MDDRKPDQSFLDFLDEYRRKAKRSARQQEAIDRALGYVTGFNAADPSLVSVRWLIKGMRAEERIEGDRAFRAEHGYQDLITIFDRQMREAGVRVQTSTVVESIRWRPGHVEVQAHGPKGIVSISSPGVLITVVLMKMAQ
jgi:phytoene dehydrogenase-like protein